jgi:hypothetical protein
MERCKRDGNHSSPQNNFIQDSKENEENGYPVLDSNKTKINDTKEPNNVHKNTLKEEITENFMEKILDIVKQNGQDGLKKFQDTKINNIKRQK